MNDHVSPDLISALIDGEVGPDERRLAHEHLVECGDCRRTMREYTSVRGMVAGMRRLAAPQALVSAALYPPARPLDAFRWAVRGPRRYVLAAAAAAAVAVSLGGLARPAGERELPVDVVVARHAGVSAGNDVIGQVTLAVTGR
jgi:anti-sigma factor RsiW